ncbi:hypothetical protein ACIQUQ_27950 [Streptomyces sp. NPDC101118]|uniref:hypothetical protein n=1 Tax=Streptomyces sp. NPDC101118 TaxID=3366109 RepID=UPI0037FB4EED
MDASGHAFGQESAYLLAGGGCRVLAGVPAAPQVEPGRESAGEPALDQPRRGLGRRLLPGGGGLALLGGGKGLLRAAEFAAQVGDQGFQPG